MKLECEIVKELGLCTGCNDKHYCKAIISVMNVMERGKKFEYYECPRCGWDTGGYDIVDGKILVSITDRTSDYEGNKSWIEYWVCPICNTEFEVENGV